MSAENSDTQEIVIIVIGLTGAGKSDFVNEATGGKNAAAVSSGLTSSTAPSNIFPVSAESVPTGIPVYIVDTRGFDDTKSNISDMDIWKDITHRLATMRAKNSKRLFGVIHLTSLQSGRFQASDKMNLRRFLYIYGYEVCRKVVLASNKGTQEQHDELLGADPWKLMIEKGSQHVPFCGDPASAIAIIDTVVQRIVTDKGGIKFDEQSIAQKLKELALLEQKEDKKRQSGWKKFFSKLRFWK